MYSSWNIGLLSVLLMFGFLSWSIHCSTAEGKNTHARYIWLHVTRTVPFFFLIVPFGCGEPRNSQLPMIARKLAAW